MANNRRGRDDQGQFQQGSSAARDAGSKGGRAAQQRGTAHKLTDQERSDGGRN
jgi:hypothetical protein